VAHLKMVVSQAFGNIDEEVSPFAKFDAQASKSPSGNIKRDYKVFEA